VVENVLAMSVQALFLQPFADPACIQGIGTAGGWALSEQVQAAIGSV